MKATFGAGCFWHVQLSFDKINGVTKTEVGYMGGKMKNPSYEAVCTDETGHAEVVDITYDETKVKYEKLLEIFWSEHNPTELNKQGPDEGTQYRSVIFYHSEEQKKIAEKSKADIQKKHKNKVVTQIVPAETFYRAEEYHQKYLAKRGQSTCRI